MRYKHINDSIKPIQKINVFGSLFAVYYWKPEIVSYRNKFWSITAFLQ